MASLLSLKQQIAEEKVISVFLKRRNHVNCIDLIVIMTKTSFTVYSVVGAGDAGLHEVQPHLLGNFLGKFERNLGKSD